MRADLRDVAQNRRAEMPHCTAREYVFGHLLLLVWKNDDINMNYRSNSEGKPFERTHTERSTHDDAAGTATTATEKE